jgi:F-type H+-transporting ATPase subunit a
MYFAAGIPILAHLYFDIFAGLLQSFIFVMLSMVFISMAMD